MFNRQKNGFSLLAPAVRGTLFSLFLLFLVIPVQAETRFVSPSGNDSNLCTTASRCRTFNRAYQLSNKGDIVVVAAGTYSGQSFSRKSAIATGPYSVTPHADDIVFRPESGPGTVILNGSVSINDGSDQTTFIEHIVLEDMHLEDGFFMNGARCVHFLRTTQRNEGVIDHSDFISFQQVNVGGWGAGEGKDSDGFEFGEGFQNVLIEDSIFRDILTDDGVAHPDGISINNFAEDCSDLTVRRNRFYNIDIINWRGGCTNMVVENNFFGASNHAFTAQIHGAGAIVRGNTFEGDIQNVGSGEGPNQRWVGNIITRGSGCPNGNNTGVVSEFNVWNSGRPATCGGSPNARPASFSGYFVRSSPDGPEGSDLRLTANATAAIDLVPTSVSFPNHDFDGNARPFGSAHDAGANEFNSGTPPPPSPPNTPGGLIAIPDDAGSLLVWGPASGATSYNIKRSTDNGGPYAQLGTSNVPSFVDSSLINGTSYFYVVSAVNSNGESGNSAQASTTPLSGCFQSRDGDWSVSRTFPTQTTSFSLQWDSVPSGIDTVVGLSQAQAGAFSDLAVIARFSASGTIEARNGGAYQAANTVNYSVGTSYRFRMDVNVINKTYSIWVRPFGGAETVIGQNFAFRTEQAGASSLGFVTAQGPPASVCSFTLGTPIAPPSGLTTTVR